MLFEYHKDLLNDLFKAEHRGLLFFTLVSWCTSKVQITELTLKNVQLKCVFSLSNYLLFYLVRHLAGFYVLKLLPIHLTLSKMTAMILCKELFYHRSTINWELRIISLRKFCFSESILFWENRLVSRYKSVFKQSCLPPTDLNEL